MRVRGRVSSGRMLRGLCTLSTHAAAVGPRQQQGRLGKQGHITCLVLTDQLRQLEHARLSVHHRRVSPRFESLGCSESGAMGSVCQARCVPQSRAVPEGSEGTRGNRKHQQKTPDTTRNRSDRPHTLAALSLAACISAFVAIGTSVRSSFVAWRTQAAGVVSGSMEWVSLGDRRWLNVGNRLV